MKKYKSLGMISYLKISTGLTRSDFVSKSILYVKKLNFVVCKK